MGTRRRFSENALVIALLAAAGCALPACRFWPLNSSWTAAPWSKSEDPLTGDDLLLERAGQGASLTRHEQDQLVAVVQQRMASESSGWLRGRMIRLLGSITHPDAMAILQEALDDPAPQVRVAACHTLVQQADVRAIPQLAGVLANDSDLDVRLAACRALGGFRDPQAVLALAAALDDRDPALQYRVVQSLRTSSGQNLGNDVTEWKKFAANLMLRYDATSIAEHAGSADEFRR